MDRCRTGGKKVEDSRDRWRNDKRWEEGQHQWMKRQNQRGKKNPSNWGTEKPSAGGSRGIKTSHDGEGKPVSHFTPLRAARMSSQWSCANPAPMQKWRGQTKEPFMSEKSRKQAPDCKRGLDLRALEWGVRWWQRAETFWKKLETSDSYTRSAWERLSSSSSWVQKKQKTKNTQNAEEPNKAISIIRWRNFPWLDPNMQPV